MRAMSIAAIATMGIATAPYLGERRRSNHHGVVQRDNSQFNGPQRFATGRAIREHALSPVF